LLVFVGDELCDSMCCDWSESLGDCSFLNTCFHMDTCKYVHYEIDYPANRSSKTKADNSLVKKNALEGSTILYPPQVCPRLMLALCLLVRSFFPEFVVSVIYGKTLSTGCEEGHLDMAYKQ